MNKNGVAGFAIIGVMLIVLVAGAAIFYAVLQTPTGSVTDNGQNNNDNPSGTFPEGTETQTHMIDIASFAFSPQELTVQVGDTVVWTNLDSVSHTVTSDSGIEMSSPLFGKDATYSHTFNTVGNFAYHCTPHPSMKGTIIVE